MNTSAAARRLPAALLALACAALAGCAGHNHTLFVTKSNAGLDFDAKPPTTEITISRKEAVIAPAFEDGKTPPVLASFSADIGTNGGFKNFAFGVDQTFAGGDAAVAMSKLFNSPVAAPSTESFDSALSLTAPPPHEGSIFRGLSGPGQTRPFIFGTDTMVGLKVGWSGVGGQIPDTLKAGFNRKEFAWAPLSYSPKASAACCADKTCCKAPDPCPAAACCKTPTEYKVRMPSFLATVDKGAGVKGQDAGIKKIQYFATGVAATHLARQPAVRQTMLARMDPDFRMNIAPAVLVDALASISTILGNLAPTNTAAKGLAEKLANLADLPRPATTPPAYSFTPAYKQDDGTPVTALLKRAPWSAMPQTPAVWSLDDYVRYLAHLESNIRASALVRAELEDGKPVRFQQGADTPVPLDEKTRGQLSDTRLSDTATLESLRDALCRQPDVLSAYYYVLSQLASH